jgi:hypothetical protein
MGRNRQVVGIFIFEVQTKSLNQVKMNWLGKLFSNVFDASSGGCPKIYRIHLNLKNKIIFSLFII